MAYSERVYPENVNIYNMRLTAQGGTMSERVMIPSIENGSTNYLSQLNSYLAGENRLLA